MLLGDYGHGSGKCLWQHSVEMVLGLVVLVTLDVQEGVWEGLLLLQVRFITSKHIPHAKFQNPGWPSSGKKSKVPKREGGTWKKKKNKTIINGHYVDSLKHAIPTAQFFYKVGMNRSSL